jgi:cell division initiation protein
MLTPQEVSGHAFPKAVVGGYNMSAVDEFLDELTDDYTALYKENAALKAKMKVLVEKVEDYRATEDSMRATLLTAQKMADSIVKEAEQKRDQMLTQAETDARVRVAQLDQETAAAQERLRAGQTELAKFIAASRAVCDREQQFLEQLPQLPVTAAAAPAPEETPAATASEIQENLQAGFAASQQAAAPAQEEPAAPAEPAPEPAPQPAVQPAPDDYPAGNPFAADHEEAVDSDPTRRINLQDLKFGRNYSRGGDGN